ncbi:MAG: hypothetical protein RMM31_10435 [Anaerolineae bacterium]|nr:hypothetical protein [Anaerolineae bacterium]
MSEPIVVGKYEIDPKLLRREPIRRCRLEVCRAACCADGVWVDLAQAERILAHAPMIQPFLPEPRRDPASWFAELHDDDPGFPSGRYTGTTTVEDAVLASRTACVFLRPEDRRCALQVAAIANGMHSWALKPFYCCLFPLVDEYQDDSGALLPRPRLTLDDTSPLFERGGGCREACAEAQPVFQVYAEETALALGIEGYRQLCRAVGVEPLL